MNKSAFVKLSRLSIALFSAQVLLIGCSWAFSAVMHDTPFKSLLSGEGVRFLFRTLNLQDMSPYVVLAILWWIAFQLCRKSQLLSSSVSGIPRRKPEWRSILLALCICVFILLIPLLITFGPQNVLLSATGNVTGSVFLLSVPYVLAIAIAVSAAVGGLNSGRWGNLYDVLRSVNESGSLPIFLIFTIQILYFIASVKFIFCI